MKRYKITLLVPQDKEVLAGNIEDASKEAERLCRLHNIGDDTINTVVRSIYFVQDEPEPIDFGFTDGEAA